MISKNAEPDQTNEALLSFSKALNKLSSHSVQVSSSLITINTKTISSNTVWHVLDTQ